MPDDTLGAPPPSSAGDDDERTLATGDLLTPKYEILRIVGSGGMGVVYEARNLQTHARVAIKMLRDRARHTEGAIARFAREARATGALRSPHVARVLDSDTTEDHTQFLVMEFYEGIDLQSELETRGQLPVLEACGLVLQACAGLAEAHAAGIVHRDLKPSNLFLAREGAERRLRILDFGVSKHLASNEDLTHSAATLGTPSYMAPEQVRDASDVDARADVWALGVILYRCVTGRPPFRGNATAVAVAIATEIPPPPRSLNEQLEPGLDASILRALEKPPAQRFQSVAELAEAISPFADPAVARSVLAEIDLYRATSRAGLGDADRGAELARDRDETSRDETSAPVTSLAKRSRARTWWIGGAALLIVAGAAASLRKTEVPAPLASSNPSQSQTPSPSPSPGPSPLAAAPSPLASSSAPTKAKILPAKLKPKKRVEDPDLLP